MSFQITVYPLEAEPIIASANAECSNWEIEKWEAWLDEYRKLLLYDAPLGGDATVGVYWWDIAKQIELPMIVSIYNNGLTVTNPLELDQLTEELDKLEIYWRTHELEGLSSLPPLHDLEEMLQKRMANFREAIKIAQQHNGVLSIG